MKFVYIYIILFIISLFMFIVITIPKTKEMYFRNVLLENNNKKKRILYMINPTAGLANTLRGMASTIFLSYLYESQFCLKGWNFVIYYFDYPRKLICNNNIISFISYKRFNISVLNVLKRENIVVTITDIHGYISTLLKNLYFNKNLLVFKKFYGIDHISRNIINSIIYREVFIPSKNIRKYINLFILKSRRKKVLGIHIRSERYNIIYTNPHSIEIILDKFFNKSNTIIQHYNITYVFTISDNIIISNKLKKIFENRIINISFNGDIIHSRYALYNGIINNNAIRIVSEFMILSYCDVIIGTQGSSFSYESCNRFLRNCIFL